MKKGKTASELSHCFDGCLYFTAGRLYRTIERLAFEVFNPLGLAPTHAFLMMTLHEAEGEPANPSMLSEVMNLDRSTVTRLIETLKKKNYIGTVSDGRFKLLKLTSQGKAALPEIKKAWEKLYEMYSRELGESRANEINRVIRKNLKDMS